MKVRTEAVVNSALGATGYSGPLKRGRLDFREPTPEVHVRPNYTRERRTDIDYFV